jgi:hypothetical protein
VRGAGVPITYYLIHAGPRPESIIEVLRDAKAYLTVDAADLVRHGGRPAFVIDDVEVGVAIADRLDEAGATVCSSEDPDLLPVEAFDRPIERDLAMIARKRRDPELTAQMTRFHNRLAVCERVELTSLLSTIDEPRLDHWARGAAEEAYRLVVTGIGGEWPICRGRAVRVFRPLGSGPARIIWKTSETRHDDPALSDLFAYEREPDPGCFEDLAERVEAMGLWTEPPWGGVGLDAPFFYLETWRSGRYALARLDRLQPPEHRVLDWFAEQVRACRG